MKAGPLRHSVPFTERNSAPTRDLEKPCVDPAAHTVSPAEHCADDPNQGVRPFRTWCTSLPSKVQTAPNKVPVPPHKVSARPNALPTSLNTVPASPNTLSAPSKHGVSLSEQGADDSQQASDDSKLTRPDSRVTRGRSRVPRDRNRVPLKPSPDVDEYRKSIAHEIGKSYREAEAGIPQNQSSRWRRRIRFESLLSSDAKSLVSI